MWWAIPSLPTRRAANVAEVRVRGKVLVRVRVRVR